MKITLSVVKADVGSIGGHTKPSERMLESVRGRLREALRLQLLVDGLVTYTGDDIAIIMSHTRGVGARDIHRWAWESFITATEEARAGGLYGAGQDLLVDAPSGNIRGAGPAVAEIEFEQGGVHRRGQPGFRALRARVPPRARGPASPRLRPAERRWAGEVGRELDARGGALRGGRRP